jgi:hypothetical protein
MMDIWLIQEEQTHVLQEDIQNRSAFIVMQEQDTYQLDRRVMDRFRLVVGLCERLTN